MRVFSRGNIWRAAAKRTSRPAKLRRCLTPKKARTTGLSNTDASQQRPISVRPRWGPAEGARNRLAAQVFEDILRHWSEPAAPGSKLCKGAEALETLYKEKPGEYLRLTASVLPREFIFENVTWDLDDEQIDELLLALRQRIIDARTAPELLASPDVDGVGNEPRATSTSDSLPPEQVEAAITQA